MKIITYNNENDWLEGRRQGIGGSDIGTILGVNPYRTPRDFYYQYHNNEKIESNIAMEAGKYMEKFIVNLFSREYPECKIIEDSTAPYKIMQSSVNPLFLGSFDGVFEQDEEKKILECKLTNRYINEPDEFYFTQVQWYLGVSGFKEACLYYLISNRETRAFWFERNDEYIDFMQRKALEFWEKSIINKELPAAINIEDMKKYHIPQIESITAEPVLNELQELAEIKLKIKELNNEKETIEARIMNYMGDYEGLEMNDKIVCTWKGSERNSFDSKRFQKENPNLYLEYLKKTKTRVFLLKDF